MSEDSFDRVDDDGTSAQNFRVLERGFVVSTDTIEAGDEPSVMVKPRGSNPATRVSVPQSSAGDRRLPAEGTEVYFTRADDDQAVLMGVAGGGHDGYEKERRIDHAHSKSHVRFDKDGNVYVEAEKKAVVNAGGDIELNAEGDIYLNGTKWSTHTHNYSWTDSGGSGTTDGVNE